MIPAAARRLKGWAVRCARSGDWQLYTDQDALCRRIIDDSVAGLELEARRATLVIGDLVDVLEMKMKGIR